MREIGTLHIKRPTITVTLRIGSRKKAIFQPHIREFTDKKKAFNKGRLYLWMVFQLLKTKLKKEISKFH